MSTEPRSRHLSVVEATAVHRIWSKDGSARIIWKFQGADGEEFSALGNLPQGVSIAPGDRVKMEGEWKENKDHGYQLHFVKLEIGEKESVEATAVDDIWSGDNEDGSVRIISKFQGADGEEFSALGNLPQGETIAPGHRVTMEGGWVKDKGYGRQFHFAKIQVRDPSESESLRDYLTKTLRGQGIGPIKAKAIVTWFGESKTIEVLSNQSERLSEVEELSKIDVKNVTQKWAGVAKERGGADPAKYHRTMYFLHKVGVGPTRAAKIYGHDGYGDSTEQKVSENPYCLMQSIDGIGFKIADGVAKRLRGDQWDQNAEERILAGLTYVMQEMERDGHCGIDRGGLEMSVKTILRCQPEVARGAIKSGLSSGELVEDNIDGQIYIFSKSIYEAELAAASELHRLRGGSVPWPRSEAESELKKAFNEVGENLNEEKKKAIKRALESKVMVLTGGPGVGKTLMVGALVSVLTEMGVSPRLCAPTGRAATVLKAATKRDATTIHKLLNEVYKVTEDRYDHQYDRPVKLQGVKYLIVDEMSMVNVDLFRRLLEVLPDDMGLLLVGDPDQLPSVEPGAVLNDIINSGVVPIERLEEVFRGREDERHAGSIIRFARQINSGKKIEPLTSRSDGSIMLLNDGKLIEQPHLDSGGGVILCLTGSEEETAERIIDLVCDDIPQHLNLDPKRHVQVLSPVKKKRFKSGTYHLNQQLQKKLNGTALGSGIVGSTKEGVQVLAPNDRVMNLNNVKISGTDVANGEVGFVDSIESHDHESAIIRVKYEDHDDKCIEYGRSDASENLELAYASTIHKSQGGEYPAVVIALNEAHGTMLSRKLLYTAVTRAEKHVILVGELEAVNRAISGEKRHTKPRDHRGLPAEGEEGLWSGEVRHTKLRDHLRTGK